MSADLSPFVDLVRQAKRKLRWVGLAPLPFVGLAFLIPFPDELAFVVLRWGFATLCLVIAGLVFASAFADPEQHPALVALRSGETSWIFVERTRNVQTKKESAPYLTVARRDGARLVLPLVAGREQEMLELAAAAAPRATCGWSPQNEQRYLADPASLMRRP